MDRPLEKKKWNSKRIMTIVGVAGLVGLISASFYFTSGKRPHLYCRNKKWKLSRIYPDKWHRASY